MRRRYRWYTVTLLLMLLLVSLNVWLQSESGVRWLLQRAASVSGGELLLGGVDTDDALLRLQQLHYHNDSVDIKAAELQLKWQPWRLLGASLVIDRLHGRDVVVRLAQGEETGLEGNGLALPLHVRLADLQLQQLRVEGEDGGELILFDILALRAAYQRDTLSIEKFNFSSRGTELQASGEIATTAPFPASLEVELAYPFAQSQHLEAKLKLEGTGKEGKANGTIAIGDGHDSAVTATWEARYEERHILLPRIHLLHPSSQAEAKAQLDLNWREGPLRYRLDSELLGGRVDSSGEVTQKNGLQWRGELKLSDIDPSVQWPQWPGRLSGSSRFSGSYQEELALKVPQLQLHGQLRNHQFKLDSTLQLQGEEIKIKRFAAHSGSASLSGKLALSEQLEADISLTAPDMAELWPGAEGSVSAHLQASGSREQPHLLARLEGSSLKLQRYTMRMLKGEVDLDLSGKQPWLVSADAKGVVPGIELPSPLNVSLRGDGSAASHLLKVTATDSERSMLGKLNGSWQQRQWQGELSTLEIRDPQLGLWHLLDPTGVAVNWPQLVIDKWCLASPPATACLGYQQDTVETRQLQLTLRQFELSRLGRIGDELPAIALPLEADVALTLAGGQPPAGHAMITVGSGTITPSADAMTLPPSPIHVSGGSLRVTARESVVTADLDFTLVSGDRLEGSASLQLDDAWRSRPLQQSLQARLGARLSELSLLALYLPPLEEAQGDFASELSIGGTLAAPLITGEAQLKMPQAQLPRLGLTLRDVVLSATSDKPGQLVISGKAASGKGELRANGWFRATGEASWHSELRLEGEQVMVSRIPEAQVTVSPDLLLQATPPLLSIRGEVRVDEARLEPREFALATTPSEDVVVIATEEEVKRPPRWGITSDIRLRADDTIYLKGYGFTGYLGGNVRFIDEAARAPRAQGELHLVPGASYRAFGQDLKAEYGRLFYADTPLDNPGLDINAVRTVGDVVAGVRIEGTAQQPQLTLFSRPAMDQVDILSYLTLGRPFTLAGSDDGNTMLQAANSAGLAGGDYLLDRIGSRFNLDEARLEAGSESGEPWLVLGRYLSPRLYVRYGVGLMESGSSLIMRYQLSERWSLQGEGGSTTGGDIIYTIESP